MWVQSPRSHVYAEEPTILFRRQTRFGDLGGAPNRNVWMRALAPDPSMAQTSQAGQIRKQQSTLGRRNNVVQAGMQSASGPLFQCSCSFRS